ncbi:MAG: ribosome-associated translation inhibitor RaiA [Dehalococcoidales bacterium]|nr:ribosome-associated translation inhibitor RaiA [Dehalococcoidales bacterium]
MELQIVATSVEVTSQAEQYIKRKITKLHRHLPGIIDIKVDLAAEGTKSPEERYLAKLVVNSKVADSVFHAEGRGENLLQAVDRVVDVMIRQLERFKGKLYDRSRTIAKAREKAREQRSTEQDTEPPRRVVKVKRFVIDAMTQEEAITRMERLGHDFFLYTDAQDHEPRLLYRRHDGNYGVIEPEFK